MAITTWNAAKPVAMTMPNQNVRTLPNVFIMTVSDTAKKSTAKRPNAASECHDGSRVRTATAAETPTIEASSARNEN